MKRTAQTFVICILVICILSCFAAGDLLCRGSFIALLSPAGCLAEETAQQEVLYVTPEQFGAKGDGVTDDTAAIQSAIDSGLPVRFKGGSTYIAVSFKLRHGTKIYGNGAVLKRPDLKQAPYGFSDDRIGNLRMFAFSGENTSDLRTEMRDLTIDINGFCVWDWENAPYIYEQGLAFLVSGTAEHKARVLMENVHFLNNYASNVTVNNHAEVVMRGCTSFNCHKGICTVVGFGSDVTVDRCSSGMDAQYPFHSFWYEANAPGDETVPNRIEITGSYLAGEIDLLTTDCGTVLIHDCILITGDGSTFCPRTNTEIDVTDCSVISCGETKVRGYGTVRFSGCDFSTETGDTEAVIFSETNRGPQTVRAFFTDCVFHDAAVGIAFSFGSIQDEVYVDHCRFERISNAALGARVGRSTVSYEKLVISNSVFDVEGYIYRHGSPQCPVPVFGGGNDVINAKNRGIRLYGGETLVFTDEVWSEPAEITRFRTGDEYRPEGIGKRTTVMNSVPSFTGIPGVDFVRVIIPVPEGGAEITLEYRCTETGWKLTE